MYNSNIPQNQELPSTAKLIKSTIIAAIVAGGLLVTVVMPAEYGIDPTGVGQIIGLKKMGEIKTSLAEEAAADKDKALAVSSTIIKPVTMDVATPTLEPTIKATLSHERKVTLAPNQGTEIKVTMVKGGKVQYSWETNGGKANFDIHADSKKLNIDYHSYSKGSEQKSNGVIEAAFDGKHGWFWRNRTSEPMTITLKTNGEYTEIEHFE